MNRDGVAHTWTAVDGDFDSGALGSGESFQFTIDQPGEYAFFCSIHPSMMETVTVSG
ncbi:MAG: plastocyanin/azurin family copper-binding protein [Acidimicrobiia bacterium]